MTAQASRDSLTLPKSFHLRSKKEFDAVFDARTREGRGPLTAHARPNNLADSRLGMSVSRKVGNAVRRNRIRRLIRESFRLLQHELPKGYDVVVIVRAHEPLELAAYQGLMTAIFGRLDEVWKKRKKVATS